ncbi:MAG: PDZ domain-containing protein, partial [Sphingomonas sp.]
LVIEHHPDRTLANFPRILVRCLACHRSTFSGVGASDKPGTVQYAPVRSLKVGSWEIRDGYASIYKSWDWPGWTGIIGMETLGRFDMTLDLPAKMMGLEPARRNVVSRSKSLTGIQYDVRADRLKVEHIMKGSPAVSSGIRVGDEICDVGVHGRGSGEALREELRSVKAGKLVRLKVCNGRIVTIMPRAFY